MVGLSNKSMQQYVEHFSPLDCYKIKHNVYSSVQYYLPPLLFIKLPYPDCLNFIVSVSHWVLIVSVCFVVGRSKTQIIQVLHVCWYSVDLKYRCYFPPHPPTVTKITWLVLILVYTHTATISKHWLYSCNIICTQWKCNLHHCSIKLRTG